MPIQSFKNPIILSVFNLYYSNMQNGKIKKVILLLLQLVMGKLTCPIYTRDRFLDGFPNFYFTIASTCSLVTKFSTENAVIWFPRSLSDAPT